MNAALSTVLITGATDGLGRHVAARLGQKGHRVIVHGRDAARAGEVADEIVAAGGPEPVTLLADLSTLGEVDRLADEVRRTTDRLEVLVNNAGIGFGGRGGGREVSADGVELRFAVNYLSGYRLARTLLALLKESAPSRIVNVASAGQQKIDFGDLMLERAYDGVTAYRRSKLAQIMFTFDLADELRGTGVTVNTLHPATFMDTTMVRQAGGAPISTVEEGGDALLRLILDPDLEQVTGRYFNGQAPARPLAQAEDPAARRRLREATDSLIAGLV
jgi:NAD(P)-dependent dehydrogenase (short-subunit alcohol dehydrogenase family)